VRLGEGTCIRARKLAGSPPRGREVAILGRRCRGEIVAGDDAIFVCHDGVLLAAVADGFGHGPKAREAATRATATIGAKSAAPLLDLVGACEASLHGTRGCVLGLARLDDGTAKLDYVGVGDVSCYCSAPRRGRRATPTPACWACARNRHACGTTSSTWIVRRWW
jgi:hypothetical protein